MSGSYVMTTLYSSTRRPTGDLAVEPIAGGVPRPVPAGSRHTTLATDNAALSRRPWTVRAGSTVLMVRGARAADLAAVAALHHRCTPTTLLYRFRSGGNPPSVTALQHMLSRALTVVVCTSDGRIVAWGAADPELTRPRARRTSMLPDTRAEIGVLVEDGWQGLGIGRAVVRHLSAASMLAGMRELVTPATTSVAISSRLLGEVGTTKRIEVEGEPMLRVLLPESAALGLGALQRLGATRPAAPARTG